MAYFEGAARKAQAFLNLKANFRLILKCLIRGSYGKLKCSNAELKTKILLRRSVKGNNPISPWKCLALQKKKKVYGCIKGVYNAL